MPGGAKSNSEMNLEITAEKDATIISRFCNDCVPTQPGLHALQNEEFKDLALSLSAVYLRVAGTTEEMIIDHPGSLHQRITDG